jgi:excisionase family DNA binding protein
MEDKTERMLSIEAAARYLGVSSASVRRLVRDGALPHARYLGALHFRRGDLDEFVNEHLIEAA